MATYIRPFTLKVPPPPPILPMTIYATAARRYSYSQDPYLSGSQTNVANIALATNDNMGKVSFSNTNLYRARGGTFFSIPAVIGVPVFATIRIKSNQMVNSLEGFRPTLYVSSGDRSSFSSGWWNDFSAGGPFYNSFNAGPVQLSFPISVGLITPGTNLSVVFGEEFEMINGGAGAGTGGKASYWNPNVNYTGSVDSMQLFLA